MLIGQFDLTVLALLIVATFLFSKKEVKIGCWIPGLLFGLILPIVSIHFEIEKVTSEIVVMDSYTVLYTYFKFPLYWIIGIVLFAILNRNQTENKADKKF